MGLFDRTGKDAPNAVVDKAIANLGKLSPAPLAARELAAAIVPAHYETGLPLLDRCDLVIEAIADRRDWKQDLHKPIDPPVAQHAVTARHTHEPGTHANASSMGAGTSGGGKE